MVLSVSSNTKLDFNYFDPQNAVVGWHNAVTTNADCNFRTSHMISVTAGDVITFGAAVTDQGWHIVTYNARRESLESFGRNKLTITEYLNELTCIMQYVVQPGVCYIRMVCDTRFLNGYLVTKNRVFSAEEYRSHLTVSGVEHSLTHKDERISTAWLLLLNVKGEGIFKMNDEVIPFEPGTVICIPPNKHFLKASETGYSDIQIYASDCFIGNKLIVTEDDNNQTLRTLAELMAKVYWNPSAQYRPFLEQLFETIQHYISYRLSQNPVYDPKIAKITNFIEKHFSDPDISLEQILNDCDYCPNHMRRLFKNSTGTTPKEYLMNLRINYAKRLLQQNAYFGYSITQIATMSGFNDISYFSRLFKTKVGVSPLEYLKKLKL